MPDKAVTKCYTILPKHIAIVTRVAQENGNSSDSAALRFIIEEYDRLTTTTQTDSSPPAPDPNQQN